MLAAKHPLVVPMLLRLSHFKLSSYVVLVVSKQKGITLVFKTDPLQNVDINSTFDSIAVIQNFIQREIEGQLRQMFREDLPGIIHRLSQQWVKAKVEAPYLSKHPPPPSATRHSLDTQSVSDRPIATEAGLRPPLHRKTSLSSVGSRKPRSTSGTSAATHAKVQGSTSFPLSPSAEAPPSSHPDLENYDPTYGLRPEGVPTKSVFRGFSNLFTPNKGLADLAEETEASEYDEYEEDEVNSFDFVDWDDNPHGGSPPASVYNDRERDSSTEYETIPAVGGGVVTRPRIYHSQSAIQPHSATPLSKSLSSLPSRSFSHANILRSGMPSPALLSRNPSSASNPYFPEYPYHAGQSKFTSTAPSVSGTSLRSPHPMSSYTPRRPPTPDSLESQPSRSSSGPTHSLSTDPTDHTTYDEPSSSTAAANSAIYMRRSERRFSVTSNTSTNTDDLTTSPPNHHVHLHDSGDTSNHPKIILRPSLNNNSIHQLSTLSHSNHTLSPYTRDLSHFTVRSVPPRSLSAGATGFGGHSPGGFGSGMVGGERQPVKAKRKRMYRLGQKKPEVPPQETAHPPPAHEPLHSSSPAPPSEFDVEDMDRYFPSAHDDLHSMPSQNRHRPRPPLRPYSGVDSSSTATSMRHMHQRPPPSYIPPT